MNDLLIVIAASFVGSMMLLSFSTIVWIWRKHRAQGEQRRRNSWETK